MTAEQQQNIGQALVKVADIAEKLIPLIRSIGEGMLTASEEPKKVTKSKTKALPAPEPEPAPTPTEENKEYTLEDVRAVLAEKSRAGHTEEVKALITKYGADRLSAVDPSNYAALMADAEGIANE